MSDFRFIQPALPRRLVQIAGYGCVGLITLIGLFILSGTNRQKEQIAEMEIVIARAAALQQTGQANAGLAADAFHTGETPQLAQAILQTNLQTLAETHKIDIEVIRTDQIEQIDGFVRLNLTVNGVAPETELGAFLHGLTAMKPIVVTEQLSLRPARTSRTNAVRRISFQLQLYGLSER